MSIKDKEPNPRSRRCSDNLNRLLQLTGEMLALADEGHRDRNDPSCGFIFGVLQDIGHKLRELAEKECACHQKDSDAQ